MKRIPFLDATRGLLACVVVAHHVEKMDFGGTVLRWTAFGAVLCFFLMSGYVLARAYDDRPAVFAARRIIRLWPLYIVCIAVGHVITATPWEIGEAFWSPTALHGAPAADGPAWTLYMEAWATFFLLPMFWVAARSRFAACVLPVACCLLPLLDFRLYFVPLFAVGVAGAQFDIRWPSRVPSWAEWLGKISFSLYLTHWLVLTAFGVWGVALVLPVAWAAWWAIERPSIAWSRSVGHKKRPHPEGRGHIFLKKEAKAF